VEEIKSSKELAAPVTQEEIANIKEKYQSFNGLSDKEIIPQVLKLRRIAACNELAASFEQISLEA